MTAGRLEYIQQQHLAVTGEQQPRFCKVVAECSPEDSENQGPEGVAQDLGEMLLSRRDSLMAKGSDPSPVTAWLYLYHL